MYQAIAMVQFVQTALRVHYNMEFAEGEYNAIDSRNLFLTGVLTGHGGTCVTLPVLYAALGQRVGYPIAVASTWEHFYCVWGEGPNSFCLEAAITGDWIPDAEAAEEPEMDAPVYPGDEQWISDFGGLYPNE